MFAEMKATDYSRVAETRDNPIKVANKHKKKIRSQQNIYLGY
jgi:hypothetical protein